MYSVRAAWLALALLVASCGGSGGGGSEMAPFAPTGSLAVTISGLPSGVDAAVGVTVGLVVQPIASTRTLTNLVAGTYTVTAASVASGGLLYVPSATSQTVTVSASATAAVAVTYSATRVALQEVASGLSMPVLLTAPSGDARSFIVERGGAIRILKAGTLVARPFLDLSARVRTIGEGGLLSMAFHPGYASNGFFFVYFVDLAGNIVIERFHVSSDPDVAETASLAIISIAHPVNTNHYGGLVAFGPDGYLYLGVGDGGGAGDVPGNAQNLSVLLGKLLRIDVANASVAQPYVVPNGNPFVGQGGRRGEIWAFGLRNPWRYAFDAASATLYIADVGQDRREEVDAVGVAAAGLDYGWNAIEGTLCYPTDPCTSAGRIAPVLEYAHDAGGGCSITGGAVYRGSAVPELRGQYFYSDYCNGWLRSFTLVGGIATARIDWNIANVGQILSFGVDAAGELYMLSATGKVYRIGRG